MNLTTHPFDDDKLTEECGIFGVIGADSAAAMTALGLHALQHRGQTSVGIVSSDGEQFYQHHALGLVGDTFGTQSVIDQLIGYAAIGHARYATTGEISLRNVQPLFANLDIGGFAVGPNGNLTNATKLREQLIKRGCIFHTTTDTEVIIHLMALARGGNTIDKLIEATRQIEGAYSLVCLTKDMLIGVRDPYGVRPLVLGKLDGVHVLSSETCGLDIIGAEFVRDVAPGEFIMLDGKTVRSLRPFEPQASKFCIFEYVYFARPDSLVEGHSVYEARKTIGMELAKEAAVEADIVVPVPDSGIPSAIGYAQQSGIPFDLGIIRNHYVGRTFIQPTDHIRHLGVKLKHNANRRFIEGKRVVLVDDSIVRGTTSVKIVEMLRAAGAKEVHMRISSPPTKHSCFYGIDTPEEGKLLAHKFDLEGMRNFIGVDSLAFISIDGLYRALGEKNRNNEQAQYCDACFSGSYPIALTDFDAAKNPALPTQNGKHLRAVAIGPKSQIG
jgi:amidophosphoribosyltransferase